MASRFGTGEVFTNSTTDVTGGSTTSSASSTASSQREQVNKDYMSAVGRQALDSLLAQLAAGGTPAQRQIQEDILRTIQQTEAQRLSYTKDAAFADAEGAMQKSLRDALEATLPSILLAGEAAGTSGDAISALLSQDLATRASGEAAQVGLGAAVDYGQLSAALLDTQASLVNRQDPALEALIQALGVDRGSAERGTKTTSGRQSSSESASKSFSQQEVKSGVQSDEPLGKPSSQFTVT